MAESENQKKGKQPTWEETIKLKEAIKKSDEKTIRQMIEDDSIDVNADLFTYWLKSWEKKRISTALHYAVKHNNLYIIKLLVELGAEVTKTDFEVDYSKKTPLGRAVDKNRASVVCYFVNICKQDTSKLPEFQNSLKKIGKMIEEYERNNPYTSRQMQSQQETGTSLLIHEDTQHDVHEDKETVQSQQETGTNLVIHEDTQHDVHEDKETGEQHQELQSRVDLLTLNWVEEKQKREITEEKLNNIEEKLKDIEDIGKQHHELEKALAAEKQMKEAAEKRFKDMEDAIDKMWNIPREELDICGEIMNIGGQGFVKKATFRGRQVVAKYLRRAIISSHNKEEFAKEKKISTRCRHKNLLEFIGAVPDNPTIIVTEMMDYDLRFALDEKINLDILSICVDVAEGLDYLHGIKPDPVIHRDVSAPNVLLKAVGKGHIAKLSDLGSAQFANIAQTVAPGCIMYSAPEVLDREKALYQTVKIDVYSYGVLLIEILTGKIPQSVSRLIDSLQPTRPQFIPMIQKCTNTEPNRRPTMKEVITLLKISSI